jgi:hypothetical protein
MKTVLELLIEAREVAKSHGDHEMVKYVKKLIAWATGRIASPESDKSESKE